MARRPRPPEPYPAFQNLPVRQVALGGKQWLGVHQSGDWRPGAVPLVCVPGYIRNMADFADFLPLLRRVSGIDMPIAALDLRGRGRSSDRQRAEDYSTLADAEDLAEVLAALGIGKCLMLGQDHGGHAIMALAAAHPALIAGTILVDCGPVIDPRGMVRMRSNLQYVAASRTREQARTALEHILAADYPARGAEALDGLAARLFSSDKRGRAVPLYDPALEVRLGDVAAEDVFEAQWPLFNALGHAPLMLCRSQLTDQLRSETFDEMAQRRSDAVAITISGQGSPALLDGQDEVGAIAEFIAFALKNKVQHTGQ